MGRLRGGAGNATLVGLALVLAATSLAVVMPGNGRRAGAVPGGLCPRAPEAGEAFDGLPERRAVAPREPTKPGAERADEAVAPADE